MFWLFGNFLFTRSTKNINSTPKKGLGKDCLLEAKRKHWKRPCFSFCFNEIELQIGVIAAIARNRWFAHFNKVYATSVLWCFFQRLEVGVQLEAALVRKPEEHGRRSFLSSAWSTARGTAQWYRRIHQSTILRVWYRTLSSVAGHTAKLSFPYRLLFRQESSWWVDDVGIWR